VRYATAGPPGAPPPPAGGGGGSGNSALFNVVAGNITLTLSLSATAANGGTLVPATITLSAPAPAGGATVTLTSSNTSAATVPPSVTVPAGQTSANFNVTTLAVSTLQYTTLDASYNGGTACATLCVIPAGLQLTTPGIAEGFGLSTFAYGFVPGQAGFCPLGMLVYGAQVFVSDYTDSGIRVFATDTDWQNVTAVPLKSFSPTVNGLAMLNDVLYAGQNSLSVFNADGSYNRSLVASPTSCMGLCADPIHNCLYVSDGGGFSTVYKYDPTANTLTSFVTGLGGPDGLVLSPDGSTLYIATNGSSADVVGVDTGSGAIIWDYNQLGTGGLEQRSHLRSEPGADLGRQQQSERLRSDVQQLSEQHTQSRLLHRRLGSAPALSSGRLSPGHPECPGQPLQREADRSGG